MSVVEQMDPSVDMAMGGKLDFYVDPTLRRHGVGSKLLRYAIDFIRNEGYSHASIRVAFSNRTAKNLYEHKGFYADRAESRHIGDTEEEVWLAPTARNGGLSGIVVL